MHTITRLVLHEPTLDTWFVYSDLQAMVLAHRPDEVAAAIERTERRVSEDGLTAAGFVCYEAAAGFDAALTTQHEDKLPLLCFGLFARVEACGRPQTIEAQGNESWRLDTQHHEYLADIVKIREL
ncbi:MAG: hypothetical protein VYD03_06450, partial [Pseudomonadota bacterium]|nr:hypothetical protein [Pseudomonadota bacterium]